MFEEDNYGPLKRIGLYVGGALLFILAAKGCMGTSTDTTGIEKRLDKIELTLQQRQYGNAVTQVIEGMDSHPEYRNQVLEAALELAEKNDSYSLKAKKHMFFDTMERMATEPELIKYAQ